MFDPDTHPDQDALRAAARQARRLSPGEFLDGPGRADRDIDPIFATGFEESLKDLIADAGLSAGDRYRIRVAEGLLGARIVASQDPASVTYCPVAGTNGQPLGVAARNADGRLIGHYTGCTLVVDPDHCGAGIGTDLVVLRFIEEQSLPLWDHDTPGYTPGGESAHLRAHEMLCRWAERMETLDGALPRPGTPRDGG